MGAALELNVTLTRIELSNCHLGDVGAVAFGSVLAENICLEVCNLSGNGIGARGAKAVAVCTNSRARSRVMRAPQ